jgi:hypothetical protein
MNVYNKFKLNELLYLSYHVARGKNSVNSGIAYITPFLSSKSIKFH